MSFWHKIRSLVIRRRYVVAVFALIVLAGSVIFFTGANPGENGNATKNDGNPSEQSEKNQDERDAEEEATIQPNQAIAPSNDPLSEEALGDLYGAHEYCSALEKACFTYSYPWTKKVINTGDSSKEEVHIVGPNGLTVKWEYNTKEKREGTCEADEPNAYVYGYYIVNQMDISPPNYEIVVTRTNGHLNNYQIGVATAKPGNTPDEVLPRGDKGVCYKLYKPTFPSRQNPGVLVSLHAMWFDSKSASDAESAKAIIRSLTY